jgi:RHS repeat-associated protein
VGDGSWRCGYRNNSGTLSDGEGLMMQFLVSGSTTQVKVVLEAGAYQWGIKVNSAGALVAYKKDGVETELGTLISAANFKRDAWYTLLLMPDQETFVTRVWERDNPWYPMGNGYYAAFRPGLSWRLRLEALNGTLWADALSEGQIYEESTNQYTAVAQTLAATQPCGDGYCYTGLGVYWTRLDSEKAATYAPLGPALQATRTWYLYDAFANRTKTQQAAWNAGQGRWDDYRIQVSGFYPNTGAPYLVGLPGYSNSYRCPAGSINGACLNATLTNDLITSSVWYLYDGSTTYSNPPAAGKLTGQSILLYYADAQNFNDPRRQDQQFGYDVYGNRTSHSIYTGEGTYTLRFQGQPRTTTYSYDPTYHTYLLSETSPMPGMPTTTYTYDYNVGLPATLTGPNGPSTTITVTYDTFGRVLNLIRPEDDLGSPTLQAIYNDPPAASRLWVELRQRVEGGQYAVWRKHYNGLGQLIQSQTMGAQVWDTGSGTQVSRTLVQDTWYDAYGQVIRQSTPYSSTQTSGYITPVQSIPATYTSYDGLGRTLQVTAADNTKTKYAYLDLEIQVTDALTHTTSTRLDVWGRTEQVVPPAGPEVEYTYDTQDRLVSASRGGATTSLEYDYAGRKTGMEDPDMGEWSYGYDTLGNLTEQTDARLCTTSLSYDLLNRLTGKTYTNCPTTAPVNYYYDAGTYGWGQRTSMTDGSGSTTWNYDARGRMTGESKTINGQPYTTQWGYNSADLPVSMTYPDNEVVYNTYKPQLLLNSVIGASTYVDSTAYDEAGRLRRRALGANTITSSFGYYPWGTPNGAGRLQTASHSNGAQTLQAFNYTYSAVGNILSLVVSDPQYTETQTYTYDALSRLTAAAVTGGPANYSESYGYSATTGNLESKGGWTLAYNDPDHVHAVTSAGGNTYGYDANGNQVTRVIGGSTYTLGYDAESRLVSVSGPGMSAQFTFDGDGRRVASTINGVTTAFVGNHYEVTGGAATKYYFAGASRVAMRQNGTLFFLLSDHLGSTSLTTDANGVKVGGLRYNAWGAVRYADGATPTKYTYTGQYSYMGEFGLMFFNARWLDPALGRFAQADSIVPGVGNPQAWDRYAYSLNNSLKYNDPSGNCYGDPNDPENPDLSCWQLYEKMSGRFTNVNIDKKFSFAQLWVINSALEMILKAFGGGVDAFSNALGEFSILSAPSLNGGMTPPGLNAIFLGNNVFDVSKGANGNLGIPGIETIIHEVGHLFDFKNSSVGNSVLPNSRIYKSQTFVEFVNSSSGCNIGYLGCLGENPMPIYVIANLLTSGGNGGYHPMGSTSVYARNQGSIEDFAVSFASFVMQYNGQIAESPDYLRNLIISVWVDLAK